MEEGSATGRTGKTASRSSRARTSRQTSVPPGAAGSEAAAAQPGNTSNGQNPPSQAPPGGLYVPAEQASGSPAREMSGPTSERPGKIVTPKQGRATHLAWSRFTLAMCSVAILGFVVVASFLTLWRGQGIDNLTRLLEIIFAPIVAVVGVAVAFYYRGSSL
jgi:hypothetical protein